MLAWLDQANAGTVQAAATRLTAAAKEIRKIAEELKVRPQWVEWKGEGADAFRAWTGDLANSTLRLGDFSADSATRRDTPPTRSPWPRRRSPATRLAPRRTWTRRQWPTTTLTRQR